MRWRLSAALALAALLLVQSSLIAPSAYAPTPAVAEVLPAYDGGYGYDPATATMYDHNGFGYSYMPDGIIRLALPWGYVTYFSFALTASYLGVPAQRTALDYTWTWAAEAVEVFNATGVSLGYDYTFTATNTGDALGWVITFDFYADAGQHMKVGHRMTNGYANALTGASFWWLFDLANTPAPYTIETALGTVQGPLYQAIPDSVHWVRLSNEFQFDWRDALVDYENGMAYIGDGSVIGLPGLEVLGVSIEVGDIAPGAVLEVDPYFSGVTRTWAAAADGYSGIAANWSPVGVPATGDNITFDATSDYNCNWNTTATVGNFSMTTGYDGTVTNAASWGAASIYIIAGTFATGTGTQYLITVDGNLFVSGNRYTGYRSSVTMTGTGSKFYSSSSDHSLTDLRVTTSGVTFTLSQLSVWRCMIVQSSITITGGVIRYISYYGGPYVFYNAATIAATGAGAVRLEPNNNFDAYLGTITAPLTFRNLLTSERIITLNTSAVCGTVSITTTSTGAMRLSTSTYAFSCTSLTLLLRGAITQGTGTLSATSFTQSGADNAFIQGGNVGITNDWTQSAGTFTGDSHTLTVGGNMAVSGTSVFTPGTGEVVLSGASKTLGTSSSDSFYDLTVSGSYTTTSSVNVTHELDVSGGLTVNAGAVYASGGLTVSGTLTLNAARSLDWNTSSGAYSNTGTIAGTGTLYLTLQDDLSLTLGTVTAPTVIRRAVGTAGTQTVTLAVDTELEADLTVQSGVMLDPNDMVVTITADLDLNLSAESSLWNITIEAGVTLNLLADLTVTLRATIDGAVTGADLNQPAPAFTSSPDSTATTLELYEYPVTWAYWDNFAVVDCPDWMYYSDGAMVGTPSDGDIGVANVSLSMTWEDMTTYQNFTVLVEAPFITSAMSAYMGLALSLVLGLGLLLVGLVFKMPHMVFFSGLIWLFSSVVLYQDINIGWAVLGIGLGVTLMYAGGFKVVEPDRGAGNG